jgi:predicted AAA+ superfamily ATPase
MWIDRRMSDQVLSAARQFPALVVTGGRQTGKTTLLRHLFPAASFASLDLPSAAYQADERGEELLRSYQEPVILDEVQYTGLLCFLLGLESPGALASSTLSGAVWETFVLGQILRARDAAGSAGQVFFWRDTHGTEVDFLIEQNARVRLIEAKWAETLSDPRALRPLLTVRDLLGERAAPEHWVACRTRHPHTPAGVPGVRLINAVSFDGWFGGQD